MGGTITFFNAVLMWTLEIGVFVGHLHALGALVVVVFEPDALGGFGTICEGGVVSRTEGGRDGGLGTREIGEGGGGRGKGL